jgi:arylsulfatase A-like enzyme
MKFNSNNIPRRHYHSSFKGWKEINTAYFFQSTFHRKWLLVFGILLYKGPQFLRKFAHKINERLFVYQKSSMVTSSHFIQFPGQKYSLLDYAYETRPVIVSKEQKELKTVIDVSDNSFIWTGFVVLEPGIKINRLIRQCDIHIDINIKLKGCNSKQLSFCLPVDSLSNRKHGIALRRIGENWTDFSIDLDEYVGQSIELSMKAYFIKEPFLMMTPRKTNEVVSFNHPCIAWSAPQLLLKKTQSEKKNIILLTCESMTDPFWMKRELETKVSIPNLEKLALESTHYTRAYAQADSTLPFIYSVFAGLFPSQHNCGNYKLAKYEGSPSTDIKTLAELMKQGKFTTVGNTSYPRFDSLYGWSKGFDSYSQATLPYNSNAPDSGWLIRTLDMLSSQDCFIWAHLNRLHGPFLSFDDLQVPRMHKSELLSEAKSRNFLPLYLDQMTEIDNQIGNFISYLKRTNQFDNTMIVLLGDHGVSMPPWWAGHYKVKYAHYEQHSRIPLIIKHPNWSDQKPTIENQPTNATLESFFQILSAAKISKPEYFIETPQDDARYNKYAIMETNYHPDYNNYGVTFVDQNYKYWLFAEMDWEQHKMLKIIEERLYLVNSETGQVNEDQNIASDNQDIISKIKPLVLEFINKNLRFQKNHPRIKYPHNMER